MNAQNMVAAFNNISDRSFGVEAVAPPDAIDAYAVCKAVWFAEKKSAVTMSLSNPAYGRPGAELMRVSPAPADWVSVNATAYLNGPSPTGNPAFSVAERARQCRQMWDWYR